VDLWYVLILLRAENDISTEAVVLGTVTVSDPNLTLQAVLYLTACSLENTRVEKGVKKSPNEYKAVSSLFNRTKSNKSL
jgi:hypothetical protein